MTQFFGNVAEGYNNIILPESDIKSNMVIAAALIVLGSSLESNIVLLNDEKALEAKIKYQNTVLINTGGVLDTESKIFDYRDNASPFSIGLITIISNLYKDAIIENFISKITPILNDRQLNYLENNKGKMFAMMYKKIAAPIDSCYSDSINIFALEDEYCTSILNILDQIHIKNFELKVINANYKLLQERFTIVLIWLNSVLKDIAQDVLNNMPSF